MKTQRILIILKTLYTYRKTTAKELAYKCKASERTIYRYLDDGIMLIGYGAAGVAAAPVMISDNERDRVKILCKVISIIRRAITPSKTPVDGQDAAAGISPTDGEKRQESAFAEAKRGQASEEA